ncbi:hypothetical protein ABZW30_34380 [Kitasatospora sp. NPDC004669]|uniref:hypothetical protein n=1 Tax=Kitasatospora sp. NPDC004669 TaxID=3154555 RepID=UPI00339F9A1B
MTTEQAVAALTGDIGPLPSELLARLLAGTGRWPLLLSLVNGVLLDRLAEGAGPGEAARWVLGRLESSGPAAFDIDPADSADRSQAVSATVDASLELLGPDERERYLDLAVLPEDAPLPSGLLTRLWGTAADLSPNDAERLRARLVRLRLVLPRWHDGSPAVGLHDVLCSWLRHRLTAGELALRHGLMVQAASGLLPAPTDPGRAWWDLPSEPRYLWQRLPYHLARGPAGRTSATPWCATCAGWPRSRPAWAPRCPPRPTSRTCPPISPTHCGSPSGPSPTCCPPGDPPPVLQATLYGYLSGVPELEPVVTSYRRRLSSPQLAPAWPLPDQPRTGALRVLTGHVNGVFGGHPGPPPHPAGRTR